MLNHITSIPNVDIYEQKPGCRTIQLSCSNAYVFLPWMVYILRKDNQNPYRRGKLNTLHVGFRTEPLNVSGDLREEILLYPPLPNIYCQWLLACCEADLNAFWNSRFIENGWPDEVLLSETALKSYEHWSSLKPDEVMAIFENWPNTIEFEFCNMTGLHAAWSSVQQMPTQLFLGDCLQELPSSAISHVQGMGRYH